MDAHLRQTARRPRSLGRLSSGRPHDARGRSHLVQREEGRDGRAGRRVRLRQVGDRAVGDEAPAVSVRESSVRQHPLRRPGPAQAHRARDPPGSRQPHLDHLPGADDVAQSAAHDREADRRDVAAASGADRGGGARAHARAAHPGRHSRAGDAAGELSASALRRPAPARDDRDGARQRARPPDRRRADHRARRHRAGADPRAAQGSAEAARHGDAVHHPRPRHRAQGSPTPSA